MTEAGATRLEVSNAGSDHRQVFAAGTSSGEGVAEGWFSSGVTFHLIDSGSGKELLSYNVEALDCAIQ